jgi:hypothetical protein
MLIIKSTSKFSTKLALYIKMVKYGNVKWGKGGFLHWVVWNAMVDAVLPVDPVKLISSSSMFQGLEWQNNSNYWLAYIFDWEKKSQWALLNHCASVVSIDFLIMNLILELFMLYV